MSGINSEVDAINQPGRYCIDTSSFLRINEAFSGASRQQVVEGLGHLIAQARVRTVRFVLEEVERHDRQLGRWLQEQRRQLLVPDSEYITNAVAVTRSCPGLVNPYKEEADVYVVAAASAKGLVVVANEELERTRRRPRLDRMRIPDACEVVGVRCITLEDLAAEEGLA